MWLLHVGKWGRGGLESELGLASGETFQKPDCRLHVHGSVCLSASPCPSWACTAYMGLWANLSVTTGGLEEQEAWVHACIWGGLPGSRTGVQNSRKGDSPDTSRALTGPDVLRQGCSPSAWMLPAQGWGTGGLISLQHPVTRPGEAWPLQALPGPPSQH